MLQGIPSISSGIYHGKMVIPAEELGRVDTCRIMGAVPQHVVCKDVPILMAQLSYPLQAPPQMPTFVLSHMCEICVELLQRCMG
jgi:hypothetical protein